MLDTTATTFWEYARKRNDPAAQKRHRAEFAIFANRERDPKILRHLSRFYPEELPQASNG